MNHNLAAHFKQWFAVSREQLAEIRRCRETETPTVQLDALISQYERLARIRRVCQGQAYFVGVPRAPRTNT